MDGRLIHVAQNTFMRLDRPSNPNVTSPQEMGAESTLILGPLIGQGRYGLVHACIVETGPGSSDRDHNQQDRAVKCIPHKYYAIAVREAYLMSSLQHEYLNPIHQVYADETHLYLIQDRADYAITQLGSEDRTERLIERWINQLLQATAYLHGEGFLHGDIKAGNVLRFGDDVRLTDFSLTTRSDWSIRALGTNTHRSPEGWTYKLTPRNDQETSGHLITTAFDLWALGCTIFEMVYGYSLFPAQVKTEHYLKAINDWASVTGQVGCFILEPAMITSEYRKIQLPYNFGADKIDTMILSLLQVDPEQRPSASELLMGYYPPHRSNKPDETRSIKQLQTQLQARLGFTNRSLRRTARTIAEIIVQGRCKTDLLKSRREQERHSSFWNRYQPEP